MSHVLLTASFLRSWCLAAGAVTAGCLAGKVYNDFLALVLQ
jgi:hypothetical protein